MSDELSIGVIGAGGRGNIVRFAHRPEQGVRMVAAADPNPEALEAFRREYGREAYVTDDYRKLLRKADCSAVFICSPDFCHEEQAVAALESGRDVYLEKPMAITTAGCDRILDAALRNKRKLYVGHNMRHMPVILKMKELIDSGRIGKVKAIWCRHFISYGGEAYFKDWHAERTKATGLLLQKGSHDIDVIHWLAGGHSTRVHAMGGLTLYGDVKKRRRPDEKPQIRSIPDLWPPLAQDGLNPVIDIEDLSMMQMQLNNGVFASYLQCHYTPDAWRNYTVIGTEGRIENFGDFTGDVVIRLWNHPPNYNPEGDEQFRVSNGESFEHGGADPRIVSEFIRLLREGGFVSGSPVAARNSVAAGFAATESLRNGGIPVDVPDYQLSTQLGDKS